MDDKLSNNQLRLLCLIDKVNSSKIIHGIAQLRQVIILLSNGKYFEYNDFIKIRDGDAHPKGLSDDFNHLLKNDFIQRKAEPGPYTRMYTYTTTDKSKTIINKERLYPICLLL